MIEFYYHLLKDFIQEWKTKLIILKAICVYHPYKRNCKQF